MSILRNVYSPKVTGPQELRRYVVSVTMLAFAATFAIDVPNHLWFFTSWADCARDWALDAAAVIAVAAPIARAIGKAHLALHEAKREAVRLSGIDPLTGLANRRAFYQAAAALEGGAAALAIVDIDRFKRINDSFGHMAGDETIKAIALLMQSELGELGAVARLGGEEFALVAAGRGAREMQARLRLFREKVAAASVEAGALTIYATVSIGFMVAERFEFDAAYAEADKALYVAKSAGRNRVVDHAEVAALGPAALARAS